MEHDCTQTKYLTVTTDSPRDESGFCSPRSTCSLSACISPLCHRAIISISTSVSLTRKQRVVTWNAMEARLLSGTYKVPICLPSMVEDGPCRHCAMYFI